MQKAWIPLILQRFLRETNLADDATVLAADTDLLAPEAIALTPGEWLQQLHQSASEQGLLLVEHQASASEIRSMLRQGVKPLLAFVPNPDKPSALIPLWVERTRRKLHLDSMEPYVVRSQDVDLSTADEMFAHTATLFDLDSQHSPIGGLVLSALPAQENHLKAEDPGTYFSPLQRFWRLMASERQDIINVYIYAILVGLFSLTLPLGVQAIMGLVAGGVWVEPLTVLIGLVILGTFLTGVLQIFQAYVVENIQQRIFTRAAFAFAHRIPRLRLEALGKLYPPELMNRFFDVMTIQKGISKLLLELTTGLLQIFFGLLLLSFYHPYFLGFAVLITTVIILVFRVTGPRGLTTSLAESKYKYRVVYWFQELARTLVSFKLAGSTRLPMHRMDHEVSGYLNHRQAHFRVLMTQYGAVLLFKMLVVGGLLILGSSLVVGRAITLGQFVASEVVIVLVLAAIEKVIANLETFYDLLTGLEKVGHVTDLPAERPKGNLEPPKATAAGFHISLKDLCYRYPDGKRDVLSNINLEIAAGERLCLVADRGGGQSTFVELITGLMEDYRGIIRYNGLSLHDIRPERLRLYIGSNLSEGGIFEGSVVDNITLGRPGIDLDRLMGAIDTVGLKDWIDQKPEGLHTWIPASGRQMSAGYQKRLLIARSIVLEPKLLIFDDFFQNIEGELKSRLIRYITDKSQPWTLVATSHDPEFMEACDRVLVLKDGKILHLDSYSKLVGDPYFDSLLPAWFSGRNLAETPTQELLKN